MLSSWLSIASLATFAGLAYSQSIDPNSVSLSTRTYWCQSQITQCPLICLQTAGNSAATNANDCDPASLTFDCVCSNGLSPNASEYSQTIPYFECTEFANQCVNSCGMNNNACASACRQDHPCGAQDPTRVNTSTISTMSATASATGVAASTASGGVVYTGFGGSGAAATSAAGSSGNSGSSATRLVLNMGELYGLAIVAGGIFAGFTFML